MPAFDPARLRQARLDAGLSKEDVALATYTSASVISRFENGTIITPTSRRLVLLAGCIGCTVSDFYDPDRDDDPVAKYDAHLRAVTATAPPLTPAQIDRLRAIRASGPGRLRP